MGNHLNREKYASFYRKIKEDAFMKIIRSIMNLIVVFVLGLERLDRNVRPLRFSKGEICENSIYR